MINETAIRCFLTLAKTLSFTETAGLTYMTQQSVSKYISRLESDLGCALFVRSHHYVVLTHDGEGYYRLFSRLENDFHRLEEDNRSYHRSCEGCLHIGVPDWLQLSDELDPLLDRFRRETKLRITAESLPQYQLSERFLSRRLDAILTFREIAPKSPGCVQHIMLKSPLLLLVSPKDERVLQGAAAADFRADPYIRASFSRESLNESRNRARRQSRELGLAPRDIVISPNLESAYMAALFGKGVLVSTLLSFHRLGYDLQAYRTGREEDLLCLCHEDAAGAELLVPMLRELMTAIEPG